MKLGDPVWLLAFTGLSLTAVLPEAHDFMIQMVRENRYGFGFLIFAFFGVLRTALKARFSRRAYPGAAALAGAALSWGCYGLACAVIFWFVNLGVSFAQAGGILPGGGHGLSRQPVKAVLTSFFFTGPFFTSLIYSLFFAPVLLAWQRLAAGAVSAMRHYGRPVGLRTAAEETDWPDFMVAEAVYPLIFRFPLMIAVFMMPPEYWLYLAAWLEVVCGGLGAMASRRQGETE
ncbi:hypothetical protein LJB86_00055 [Deltaproteobacteria bacterium OttesenSCG-928-M10]|nr:hypothetical protein [Deltaproteobacteria bacterium OttesenSCG-928-M10]